MNLFLHVKLLKDQFDFAPPLVVKGFQYFDLDNYSSPEVIQVAKTAIEKADKVFLFFELREGVPVGHLLKIAMMMANFKNTKKVVYEGMHDQLVPLLLKLGAKNMSHEDLVQESILFLNEL